MSGYRESGAEDRSVLVAAIEHHVYGLDAARGEVRWSHRFKRREHLEVLVKAERVYATDGQELACLDYLSGNLIGQVELPSSFTGRPTMLFEGQQLFVASNGRVWCFDLAGQLRWERLLPDAYPSSVALAFPGSARQADSR